MCGFSGLINFNSRNSRSSIDIVQRMSSKLEHRGPDSAGIWASKLGNIAFAHKRLAIQDLSAAGAQPFTSSSGKLVIVFNGEIYNHLELRMKYFKDFCFKGSSDTETLIEVIEKFGISKTLSLVKGMFAFSVANLETNKVFLARDIFGEKPLYYFKNKEDIVFASELKSFTGYPFLNKEIDYSALNLFFKYSYISGTSSIYKNIKKLAPGTYLEIDTKEIKKIFIRQYWNIKQEIISSKNNSFKGGINEAIEEGDRLLNKSVRQQLISDVPIGVFLSGGIDSSIVSFFAHKESNYKIKTFNIGFTNSEYDESKDARAFAESLGTNHEELIIKPSDVMSIVNQIPSIYDEPFADATQIPTILLSRMASKSVKVALGGEGGDELFGGYSRYNSGVRLYNQFKNIPPNIRNKLLSLLRFASPSRIDLFLSLIKKIPYDTSFLDQLSRKIYKLSNLTGFESIDNFYNSIRSSNLSFLNDDFKPAMDEGLLYLEDSSQAEFMMLNDTYDFLPNNLCKKIDMASMASSLEARLPFLDRDLFKFAWSLPENYKISNSTGKLVLRKILEKNMPNIKRSHSKKGFTLPLGDWLREDLKEWASDVLSIDSLEQFDFINAKTVQNAWSEHLSEKNNYEYQIWPLLMFLVWHNNS